MSEQITDWLDNIDRRANEATSLELDDHNAQECYNIVEDQLPALSALRAVMGLHVPVPPLSNPDPTPVCRNCDWDYPCPTVKAIGDALGVEVTE